ncbi:MAG: HD domain-containing protein, partial [bacterium]
LDLLDRAGLLAILLPEVHAMKGVPQPARFHPEGDVFAHTKKMLDSMVEPSVVLAFSVLLHDVGKPPTFSVSDRIHFTRHQTVGGGIARGVCNRLRFPNHLRDRIAACVENHMAFLEVKKMKESTIRRLLRRPTFLDELELHRLDCLASDRDLSAWELLTRKVEECGREETIVAPLINGHDLLHLGFSEGPLVGKILREIEDLHLEGALTSREEAIEWVKQRHKGVKS